MTGTSISRGDIETVLQALDCTTAAGKPGVWNPPNSMVELKVTSEHVRVTVGEAFGLPRDRYTHRQAYNKLTMYAAARGVNLNGHKPQQEEEQAGPADADGWPDPQECKRLAEAAPPGSGGYAAACRLLAARINVIPPPRLDTKTPAGLWKHLQSRPATLSEVQSWYAAGNPGVSMLCGTISGRLLGLDIEGRAVEEGAAEAWMTRVCDQGHEALLKRVASDYLDRSPSGGLHVMWRISLSDGEEMPRSTKLAKRPCTPGEEEEVRADEHAKLAAKLNDVPASEHEYETAKCAASIASRIAGGKVLIETRGEAGYMASPGGGAHGRVMLHGDPASIATITPEESGILLQAARDLDTMPERKPAEHTSPRPAAPAVPGTIPPPVTAPQPGDRPGDHFNRDAGMLTCTGLHETGWAGTSPQPADGQHHLTRPGKDPRDGTSATVRNVGGRDWLYVHTSSSVFDPGHHGTFDVLAVNRFGGDHSAAARALASAGWGEAPKLPPQDHGITGPPPAAPTAQPAATPVPEGDIEARYPRLNFRDLLTGDIEPPDWLCEPFIEAATIIAIYSEPKAGKSLLLFEAAVALAAGRGVFGNPPRDPIKIIYIDMENSENDLRERLRAMGYTEADADKISENLIYLSFPVLPPLDTPQGGSELAKLARHHGARLIILDTLSRVVAGHENDSETYLRLYRETLLGLKREKIAVVRLDHAGKDVDKGQRGSSAKEGDVDCIWALTRDDDTVTMKRTHSRNTHGPDEVRLQRLTDPLRHEITDTPSLSRSGLRGPVIPGDAMEHISRLFARLQVRTIGKAEIRFLPSERATLTAIRNEYGDQFSRPTAQTALDHLVKGGYLNLKKVGNRAKAYVHVKPFSMHTDADFNPLIDRALLLPGGEDQGTEDQGKKNKGEQQEI